MTQITPYTINYSDGADKPPFQLQPGQDHRETSLSLFGLGAVNYGEGFNENFLKMLEHFSSAIPPRKPTRGQIWYDTSTNTCKAQTGIAARDLQIINAGYDASAPYTTPKADLLALYGNPSPYANANNYTDLYNISYQQGWQPIGITTSDAPPSAPGQIRYDEDTDTLYFWDGSIWQNLGGVIVGDTAPPTPARGQLWFDTTPTEFKLKIAVNSPLEWVVTDESVIVDGIAPASPGDGRLWFDTTLLKLFVWDGVEWRAAGGVGAIVHVGIVPPSNPQPGQLWWNSDIGRMFIYYDDGQGNPSAQWVETSPSGGGGGGGTNTTIVLPGVFTRRVQPAAQRYWGQTGGGGTIVKNYTFSHNFGVIPDLVTIHLKCVSAEYGFVLNDIVPLPIHMANEQNDADKGYAVKFTTTEVQLSIDDNHGIQIHGWNTTGNHEISNNRWDIIVTAYAGNTASSIVLNKAHKNGYKLTYNTTTSIGVGPGELISSEGVPMVNPSATFYKSLAATWVAGAGSSGAPVGGRSGAVAVTAGQWWGVFVLVKANGDVDIGYDLDVTGATLLADTAVSTAGFIYAQRIGFVGINSSDLIFNFLHYPAQDLFVLQTPATTIKYSEFGLPQRDITLNAPPNVLASFTVRLTRSTSSVGGSILVLQKDQAALAPVHDVYNTGSALADMSVQNEFPVVSPSAEFSRMTDSTSQIRITCSNSSATSGSGVGVYIRTNSWIDSFDS